MTFAAIALLALLIAAAVIAIAVRRRRARLAPLEGVSTVAGPPPREAPLPVVLVHGMFGFDRIGVPGAKVHYFRGIARHLEDLGCQTHTVRLPSMASVPERARMLVEKIDALGHDRVDIIAHSLGGLDARYAVSQLGLATRVRSLVTVGTPHRGTPLADLATEGPLSVARRAIGALGISMRGLDWLSTAALERFNTEVPDAPGVRYACVVGGIRRTSPALAVAPVHAYLRRVAGPNDGIVPIASQYWGVTLAEIEADHFQQVGWHFGLRSTFDALGLYAFVVSRLGEGPVAKPAARAATG